MRNWKQELELDPDLNDSEKERFLELVENAGIPSIEEFAKGEPREEVQESYWKKYGEEITELRDKATEEANIL